MRIFSFRTGLPLCVLTCAVWLFFSWKPMAERQLERFLEARGFHNVEMTLVSADLSEMHLQDIKMKAAGDVPVGLRTLVLRYSFKKGLSATAENLLIKKDALKAAVGSATFDVRAGKGAWAVDSLMVDSGSLLLPPLAGKGGITPGSGTPRLDGVFKSADGTHRFDFDLEYPRMTLRQATMPWQGGRLAAKDVIIPLEGKKAVAFDLLIEEISIGELLQLATGKRVMATGAVSGRLPLTIGENGGISFGNGLLRTEKPGTITMPPETIPGDNPQVQLTRDILRNFHYDSFSLSISDNGHKGISLLAALKGRNPDMYSGRSVSLNVRLNGDVLDFIRRNIVFLSDPQSILGQEKP